MALGAGTARWQSLIETVAIVSIAIAIAWQTVIGRSSSMGTFQLGPPVPPAAKPQAPLPTQPVTLEGAATVGSHSAKLALILFSDFQCPFCGKFEHETFPELKKRYLDTGQLLLAFREFPLTMHAHAQKAAEAAECAAHQGRFWEMHDQLFSHQQLLEGADLTSYAKALGLNQEAFSACMAGGTTAKVADDTALGLSLNVTGTPTLFLGVVQADGRVKVTKRWSGVQPLSQIESAVDAVLPAHEAADTLKK